MANQRGNGAPVIDRPQVETGVADEFRDITGDIDLTPPANPAKVTVNITDAMAGRQDVIKVSVEGSSFAGFDMTAQEAHQLAIDMQKASVIVRDIRQDLGLDV